MAEEAFSKSERNKTLLLFASIPLDIELFLLNNLLGKDITLEYLFQIYTTKYC